MNRFIETVDFERAPVPHALARENPLHEASIGGAANVVLFTNRAVKLHLSYQRFLENQTREAFGFLGTPIWIKNSLRN